MSDSYIIRLICASNFNTSELIHSGSRGSAINYVGHFKSSAHYVFSLKMNLFYKIHLQAFSVIVIVLYHSCPTFGEVLYSCQDAFVVGASDYSGHLIGHLLNASEAFPTEWLLNF